MKITTLKPISLNEAEELAYQSNGYNGVLDDATICAKDSFEVLIEYTLFHQSGDAARGIVGASLVRAKSIDSLINKINQQMADVHHEHQGNTTKESFLYLSKVS